MIRRVSILVALVVAVLGTILGVHLYRVPAASTPPRTASPAPVTDDLAHYFEPLVEVEPVQFTPAPAHEMIRALQRRYPTYSESIILNPRDFHDGPWSDYELYEWTNATVEGREAQKRWWRSRH